ncbi:cysteine-rich receptor-like protein kinase, partial [Trifolium pratense]
GGEASRKISWIEWDTVCLLREYGGSGVRQISEFNTALLGCGRGRMGSSWWREIVRIRDGVGGTMVGWFGESVGRKVEDGTDTLFWTDPWLGGSPLCDRFSRLFDLATTKSSTVAEMFSLGWEAGGEAWV